MFARAVTIAAGRVRAGCWAYEVGQRGSCVSVRGMNRDDYLTAGEVYERYGVQRTWLRNRRDRGEVEPVVDPLNRGRLLYPRDQIAALVGVGHD